MVWQKKKFNRLIFDTTGELFVCESVDDSVDPVPVLWDQLGRS